MNKALPGTECIIFLADGPEVYRPQISARTLRFLSLHTYSVDSVFISIRNMLFQYLKLNSKVINHTKVQH